MIFSFLWKKSGTGKKACERLKRTILCLEVNAGGLGMISIQDQQHVTLIRWLQRVYDGENESLTFFTSYFFRSVGGLKYASLASVDLKNFIGISTIKSYFWKRVLQSWLLLNKHRTLKADQPTPIFNNVKIQRFNRPLFIKRWINSGILYIHDIVTNGTLKPMAEVANLVGRYGGLLFDYLAVSNAVRKSGIVFPPVQDFAMPEILKLSNKQLRNKILLLKDVQINSINVWKRKFNIDITDYFGLAIVSTKESQLRLLHFKLCHNIYPTNIFLHQIKLKDSNNCDRCRRLDTLEHSFYYCPLVKYFWDYIQGRIFIEFGENINIDVKTALFGIPKSDVLSKNVNHMLLIAKFALCKSKLSVFQNINVLFEQEFAFRKKYFPSHQ